MWPSYVLVSRDVLHLRRWTASVISEYCINQQPVAPRVLGVISKPATTVTCLLFPVNQSKCSMQTHNTYTSNVRKSTARAGALRITLTRLPLYRADTPPADTNCLPADSMLVPGGSVPAGKKDSSRAAMPAGQPVEQAGQQAACLQY